ncbi:MAG: hypothetical protein ACXIUM_05310 [Wenzhouxiangella sp.]
MKHYFRTCSRTALPLFAVGMLLAACGPASDVETETDSGIANEAAPELAPAPETLPVQVWSYRPESVLLPVLRAFTASTGIPTAHRILRGDEILDVLPATRGPDRPDLLLTVDALRFARLAGDGQLASIDADALVDVPATLRDPHGAWAAISWRARGIVQRRDEARDLDWSDLSALASQGRLCVRPGAHVYNRSLLAWQILRLGEDAALAWAEAVHGAPTVADGGDRDQIMAVADGRCDVAIVNHYYLARMRLDTDTVQREAADQVLFGNPNQPLAMQPNISGIALVSDSPNAPGGLALARWMLDPANQGVYANPVAEFPASWPTLDLDLGEALDAFEVIQLEGPWPTELAPAIEATEGFFEDRAAVLE